MPKEIFDQDRPRSTMARQLDEAFAGCDQWTLAPPSRRRSDRLIDHRIGSTPTIPRAVTLRAEGQGAL
jgi:hypothetical protein